MDLLEDTDLRRGHGSEAVHGFKSYIYTEENTKNRSWGIKYW